MSTLTKALRWGLHLLGEDAEARIRDLTRRAEGLQAAYDLLSASAEAERQEARELRGALADKALILQEIARLRDLTTPRTYQGGPQPEGDVLWWDREWDREWRQIRGEYLDPGDIWLPVPPDPGAWQGSSGPLDPAQAWGADALLKVTQERDEARRDAADTLATARQQIEQMASARDAARHCAEEAERSRGVLQAELARLVGVIKEARRLLRQRDSGGAYGVLAVAIAPGPAINGDWYVVALRVANCRLVPVARSAAMSFGEATALLSTWRSQPTFKGAVLQIMHASAEVEG